MIRKPPGDWNRLDEGAAVRTVRTASAVAKSGADVARRGGYVAQGLLSYLFAALWCFAAVASGLSGDLPSLIGIGAMTAGALWFGRRAFAKARATTG
jgi:hypothetical protein